MMIKVKNHQMAPTILVLAALGLRPEPWRRKVPVMNQKLLLMLNWFSITSFSEIQSDIFFNIASVIIVAKFQTLYWLTAYK